MKKNVDAPPWWEAVELSHKWLHQEEAIYHHSLHHMHHSKYDDL